MKNNLCIEHWKNNESIFLLFSKKRFLRTRKTQKTQKTKHTPFPKQVFCFQEHKTVPENRNQTDPKALLHFIKRQKGLVWTKILHSLSPSLGDSLVGWLVGWLVSVHNKLESANCLIFFQFYFHNLCHQNLLRGHVHNNTHTLTLGMVKKKPFFTSLGQVGSAGAHHCLC